MSEGNQQAVLIEDERASQEPSYLLSQLEVYNWGPFNGLHRAEFDRDGTAIIGPTGSGKTTLVDALMTLLVERPKYNLASTGGHESDRSLISYVRGVLSADGRNASRTGKTITGICATYQYEDETLKLGALLKLDGTSNSPQDLKRYWIYSRAENQSLEMWLRILHEDSSKALKRVGKETAGLRIIDSSKKVFLTHVRKFFDVGENAFALLNRAAGLKQLNSIDDIFRDLVLEDNSAFNRALEVAAEFDNLEGIHTELELARKQRASLLPVAKAYETLEKIRSRLADHEKLKQILPVWFAIIGQRLWSDVLDELVGQKRGIESTLKDLRATAVSCESRVDTLKERFLELGGDVIDQLQKTIDAQTVVVNERQKYADDYRRMVATFSLDDSLLKSQLIANQKTLSVKRENFETERTTKFDEVLGIKSELRDLEKQRDEVNDAIQRVQARPGSNVPLALQDFRADLASQLDLRESDLPFLAELVEVKKEELDWRGAIERALGAERLRILVPSIHLQSTLSWINHRHNKVHVRLQGEMKERQSRQFFADGFAQKLNFKSHGLASTAKAVVCNRDLHCVDSAEELRQTNHAITIEGMMSGKGKKFDKQDNRRLNENWMTGFDNRDQLQSLMNEGSKIDEILKRLRPDSDRLQHELKELESKITIIKRLLQLDFSTIDLPKAEQNLKESKERLHALLDPDSDASKAKLKLDKEVQALNEIRAEINQFITSLARIETTESHAETERSDAERRKGNGLSEGEMELAEDRLPIDANLKANGVTEAERKARLLTDKQLEEVRGDRAAREKDLIRLMGAAKRVDTGALVDCREVIEDIDEYLERLRVLNEEALPEKQERFLQYLNRSSDQGVTQLLAGIKEEVDAIKLRIQELNRTLTQVDYHHGRYLQLQPKNIQHESIRSLDAAMRKVRSAALQDDHEIHFKALQNVVEILREAGDNRRREGSRALLDPRYRLKFFVVDVDKETGESSEPRSGSQSGSGGEKELMASHILTASLSYALCPAESKYPLYGTVVLDEAFSKSSPSAASRIIEALRIFKLHPIFVTPNKEIGLLKQHTKKVICVQRPKQEASLASISWEVLEEIANS